MKIAIVGSRDFPMLGAVRELVRKLPKDTIVVSGGAPGVDTVAVEEAKRIGLVTVEYPVEREPNMPRWKFAVKAHARNQLIVDQADKVIAFWDGKSRGTRDTIKKAQAAGKPVEVGIPFGKRGHWHNVAWGTSGHPPVALSGDRSGDQLNLIKPN